MDRSLLEAFGRRVRVGIVGGGTDSVIGRTHLIAMRADGLCDLVANAMSVDPEIALSSGRQELLTTDRLTRAVLPQMLARPKGKIVVVGSATGLRGQPRRAAYAEHRFLREPKTLSPAAVIFHRDKCQDLMGCEICCKPAHTDRKIH